MKLDTTKAPRFKAVVELRHFALEMRRFELREVDGDELRCDIVCVVRDRESGSERELHWSLFMSAHEPENRLVMFIHKELRNMLVHELEEAWHVDGRRVHDPHQ